MDCRPIVLIRFNPDNYTEPDGTVRKSPWTTNKTTGCLVVTTKNTPEWIFRLSVLKETIDYYINFELKEPLFIKNLFC